jgi:hypothetical protein
MSPAHFPSGALVCITEGTETPTETTEAKRRTRRVGFIFARFEGIVAGHRRACYTLTRRNLYEALTGQPAGGS